MKFSILALGAAVAGISCVNQCAAQLQIEPSGPARMPEARLISQNQDFFAVDGQTAPRNTSQEADYFAEQSPQAEISDSQSLRKERSVMEKQIPVTTQAPLEVLNNTPEVGMVPVYWPQSVGGCPTPNPVASYMYRNWCTQGLWDTYPCQRSLQCQHIQQQIHGYNRYTGRCSSCVAPVSAGCASGNCASGNCGAPASGCASNAQVNPATQVASAYPTSAPAATSPLLGEYQVGLPQVNLPELPQGVAPAQLTGVALPPIPNASQYPNDLPTVPPAGQNLQLNLPAAPQVLPALPLPTANPVVASRAPAPLR